MKKLVLTIFSAAAVAAFVATTAATRSNKTEIARNLNVFNSIYKELQTTYVDTIDATKSMRTAIDAMLGQIDPYTEYYPADEQEEIRSVSSGEYAGIGSYIMKRNGKIMLSEPQWESPARKAGVRHGDILLAINGDTLSSDMTTEQASGKLRGQPGTKIRITVQRPWVNDSILDFEITRGTIRINPLPYYGYLRDGVGYIRLTTFNEKSAKEVKNALTDLKKNPEFRSLVLDLRGNGGGLLESAVQIVGHFVPKGTEVLRTKGRDASEEKIYKTTQSPIDTGLPVVVLIDEGTASSAEIVSGALQDLDRAVIIGTRSYGKGLVQSTRPLPYDGLLKVTVARYYIPSGRLIQAIDYSHRNPDGSVARIPDSLTNVFHTANGREVRDGGGITPDVKVEQPETNRLLYNVVADMWAYDYATRFAARNASIAPAGEFVVGDSIFSDFKKFIDPDRFKYDRLCESGITYLREAAEAEGYMNDSVAAQFDILESMLKHDLNRDLDFNRDKIIEVLDSEISSRYYSDGECVMRSLRKDMDLESAFDVLLTPGRYHDILSPGKDDK